MSELCPFCGENLKRNRREEGNVVVYECAMCGSIVSAYLKEYESILATFFGRYKLDTFKPTPPNWIKR